MKSWYKLEIKLFVCNKNTINGKTKEFIKNSYKIDCSYCCIDIPKFYDCSSDWVI